MLEAVSFLFLNKSLFSIFYAQFMLYSMTSVKFRSLWPYPYGAGTFGWNVRHLQKQL